MTGHTLRNTNNYLVSIAYVNSLIFPQFIFLSDEFMKTFAKPEMIISNSEPFTEDQRMAEKNLTFPVEYTGL